MNNSVSRIGLYALLLVLAGLGLYLPTIDKTTAEAKPQNITGQTAQLPVLLEFTSPECDFCRKMRPVIEQLKKEFSGAVEFREASLATKEGEELSKEFNPDGLPSFFVFDRTGRQTQHFEGVVPVEMMRKILAGVAMGEQPASM